MAVEYGMLALLDATGTPRPAKPQPQDLFNALAAPGHGPPVLSRAAEESVLQRGGSAGEPWLDTPGAPPSREAKPKRSSGPASAPRRASRTASRVPSFARPAGKSVCVPRWPRPPDSPVTRCGCGLKTRVASTAEQARAVVSGVKMHHGGRLSLDQPKSEHGGGGHSSRDRPKRPGAARDRGLGRRGVREPHPGRRLRL